MKTLSILTLLFLSGCASLTPRIDALQDELNRVKYEQAQQRRWIDSVSRYAGDAWEMRR